MLLRSRGNREAVVGVSVFVPAAPLEVKSEMRVDLETLEAKECRDFCASDA